MTLKHRNRSCLLFERSLLIYEYTTKSSTPSSSSTNSTDLGRIRYLSLKNYSQLLEDKHDYAGALEYTLLAKSMSEFSTGENHLLMRICNLSVQLGDSWTPKMLLKLCPEFRDKGMLPVALRKLWADINRLDARKLH